MYGFPNNNGQVQFLVTVLRADGTRFTLKVRPLDSENVRQWVRQNYLERGEEIENVARVQ